jgi:hypothetical protein
MAGAERPAVLPLVTRETGAAIGPEILEKGVFRRYRRTIRLKARNRPARIGAYFQLRDDRRDLLRGAAGIRKQFQHLLGVRYCAGPRRSTVIGQSILRCRMAGNPGEQSGHRQPRDDTLYRHLSLPRASSALAAESRPVRVSTA